MTSVAIFIPGIIETATVPLQLYITKLIWWYVLDFYNTPKLSNSITFLVRFSAVYLAVK